MYELKDLTPRCDVRSFVMAMSQVVAEFAQADIWRLLITVKNS